MLAFGSMIFAGVDKTSGDSGACGINKALVITMPFRLAIPAQTFQVLPAAGGEFRLAR